MKTRTPLSARPAVSSRLKRYVCTVGKNVGKAQGKDDKHLIVKYISSVTRMGFDLFKQTWT
jgi:hypothetical protein